MRYWRLAFAVPGVLLGLFGIYRLATQVPNSNLISLGYWLLGALIIHDGILAPVIVGIGWAISRVVPPRARRYLQAALIMGGLVTVIAIPMIYRRDSQPKSKAILQQNFGGNLALLLGIIGGLTLLTFAARVARDRATRRTGIVALPTGADDSPIAHS